ncbi:MAG: methyltransferase [Motiliproteus sp.]
MNNEWDQYAEGWDTDSSVQVYAANAFKTLSTVVEGKDLSVFDFGCGTGSLTQLLSRDAKEIVALDGSAEMVKRVVDKKLQNVTPIAGFLTTQLIASNPDWIHKFDLVVASSVCGFLPDYESTLGLLKSLMKPGASFVQWDWLAEDDGAATGLPAKRVLAALQHHQFINIQVSQPFDMVSARGIMQVLMAVAKTA